MRQRFILSLLVSVVSFLGLNAQNSASLTGVILSTKNEPIPYATVQVSGTNQGTVANAQGQFTLKNLSAQNLNFTIRAVGYQSLQTALSFKPDQKKQVKWRLKADALALEEAVVSATRYHLDKKEAPVIVNVLTPALFTATQSMALADGLNYQSGVRVETNCQNCGFTQVRLNGLEGQYTQILINSRPIFSALNSVYGLDQIPTNMIERVEIVRGGGSALYGSNAIAGTVNIITKDPILNSWQVETNLASIQGQAADNALRFNGSVVADDLKSGITLYGMKRSRAGWDASRDGFTELTQLENNTFGLNTFYKPNPRAKLSFTFNAINEYRRGGDRLHLVPHFTDITEELDHNTLLGGLTYEQASKNGRSNFSVYASLQSTQRQSYYGGLGGGRSAADSSLALSAYGQTTDLALVTGFQFNQKIAENGRLLAGAEWQNNAVEDEITGYQRRIDQNVTNTGTFVQYEWQATPRFKLLAGTRFDYTTVQGLYNLGALQREANLNAAIISPRANVLYNLTENWQWRASYARGFRAPQAFNEDLHISSVGGEAKFLQLSNDLRTEFSDAWVSSLNYSANWGKSQVSFLVEGFYTLLSNPFTAVSTGATLPNGSIVEEVRNGSGAYVSGINFEYQMAPGPNIDFALGGTLQRARYLEKQALFEPGPSDNLNAVRVKNFTRNPNWYGYTTANWQVSEFFDLDVTGSFTGPMQVPLVINQSGFLELKNTPAFYDVNGKLTYRWVLSKEFELQFSGGVRNMFNSFQRNFSNGATRDSDFVFGPAQPRTYFIGVTLGNLP
jgi:outer membrane receptor for ferrienterochelin and colicins